MMDVKKSNKYSYYLIGKLYVRIYNIREGCKIW